MYDNIHPTLIFKKSTSKLLPNLVADALRQAIRDGRLKPGQQLPSEPEFSEQMGVSRTTLRDAIRMLVSNGALERRRGVGTFVAHNSLINIHEGLETLVSTSDVIRAQGYEPGTSQCAWELIPAAEDLAKIFGIAAGTLLIHLARTRTANGVPVIHCEEYVPTTIIESARVERLTGDWSLYGILREAYFEFASAICKVIPVVANEDLASRLNTPLHHPLLLLRQTHYASEHKPILYCENYHNSSIIEFHIVRRP